MLCSIPLWFSNSLCQFLLDDTAMTRSICSSLINCGGLDPVHLAKCFAKEFDAEQDRGYGGGAMGILRAWCAREPNKANVYKEAGLMFNGSGSYGNGAAMRVAPVALFAKDLEQVIEVGLPLLYLLVSGL